VTGNKRIVAATLEALSGLLGFRFVDGLAERAVYREFFPRGLTALDAQDTAVLGTRPLLYFRGLNECRALRWVSEPAALAALSKRSFHSRTAARPAAAALGRGYVAPTKYPL
jgi:ATPase MipZ